MSKRPWFSLYVNDWLGSTRIALLDPLEELGFFRLLLHMWNSPDCALPDKDETLFKLSRMGESYCPGCGEHTPAFQKQMLSGVKALLSPHPTKEGFLTERRMFLEYRKCEEVSLLRSESGRLGGRPSNNPLEADNLLVKQMLSGRKQKLSGSESKTKAKKSYSHTDPDPHSDPKREEGFQPPTLIFEFQGNDARGNPRAPHPNFPKLWFSELELASAKKRFDRAGLLPEFQDLAFMKVEQWFTDTVKGRKEYPKSSNHFRRVIDWGIKSALENQRASDSAKTAHARLK